MQPWDTCRIITNDVAPFKWVIYCNLLLRENLQKTTRQRLHPCIRAGAFCITKTNQRTRFPGIWPNWWPNHCHGMAINADFDFFFINQVSQFLMIRVVVIGQQLFNEFLGGEFSIYRNIVTGLSLDNPILSEIICSPVQIANSPGNI